MHLFQKIKQFMHDRSGNVLILSALSITTLVGMAGLAADTIQWTVWKRQLQREADSAALAGTIANYQGGSASTAANAEITRHGLITLHDTPLIEVGPSTGPYAGDTTAVRVALNSRRALPFSSFILQTPPTIRAEATAAAVSFGTYCVLALESTSSTGVTMQGSATVDLGCGMATNSQGSTAVSAGGGSTINASPISAVGGIPASTSYVSGTVLQPNSMPQADPFSGLPTPSLPSCSAQLSVAPNATRNISNPGGVSCYRGMDLKGTVNFASGIYYIDGGVMSFGAQADVTGTNVVFILTSATASSDPTSVATLSMTGGATVNLTAPTTGTYAGVLFYQDRRASTAYWNYLTGNSSSLIQGAIYFPRQLVQYTGNTGINTNCMQLVAKNVTFTGNSAISNVCPPGSGGSGISGRQIRLVN